MAVNLFGLPEPDDLLGQAQKAAMESARRFAEMTRGIDLARKHQALADRALEMQAVADRALEPTRAAERARQMMGTEFTDLEPGVVRGASRRKPRLPARILGAHAGRRIALILGSGLFTRS